MKFSRIPFSQNTYGRLLLRKIVVRPKACNFIKKETLAQVFPCEFFEIFKNAFFYKTPLVAVSASSNFLYGDIHFFRFMTSIPHRKSFNHLASFICCTTQSQIFLQNLLQYRAFHLHIFLLPAQILYKTTLF